MITYLHLMSVLFVIIKKVLNELKNECQFEESGKRNVKKDEKAGSGNWTIEKQEALVYSI